MPAIEEISNFYNENYSIPCMWTLSRSGEKHYLGDRENRHCRFCLRHPESLTFKKVAHAIPEAIGNNSLFSFYECDECNERFGRTIETDFGEWSKPIRTSARIRGKKGAPSIRLDHEGNARIDVKDGGLRIREYEDDPHVSVDEAKKTMSIDLRHGAYTPIGVHKAFVKFGLSIVPEHEMPNFDKARKWIATTDHSDLMFRVFPILRTFIAGPIPNDKIVLMLMFRKSDEIKLPYAFLILSYGNEVFQVCLPSPERDSALIGETIQIPAFPNPYSMDPDYPYPISVGPLDLSSTEKTRGKIQKVQFSFDSIKRDGV